MSDSGTSSREHRLMPNMLRHVSRHVADQIIADVEDSLWLAEHIDAVVVEEREKAARIAEVFGRSTRSSSTTDTDIDIYERGKASAATEIAARIRGHADGSARIDDGGLSRRELASLVREVDAGVWARMSQDDVANWIDELADDAGAETPLGGGDE